MEIRLLKSKEKRNLVPSVDFKRRSEVWREIGERRKSVRLSHHFSAKLSRLGLYFPIEGMTENVGPCGAFIKLNELHAFQLRDQIILTLFIPPNFSGQEKTFGLQGPARMIRLAGDNEGVAVKFSRPLKQFERTNNQKKQLD
jgi:hypothetical protein